ncbi:MAG: 30S ribosomal protein S18 [Candidatus Omnitrophica bacterium]|nr:30S ribosomal protein S18 [Candidatus Omnitrophota bacterium]
MKKKTETRERKVFKKKPCKLCRDKVTSIDYKNTNLLSRFISEKGRIITSRITGNCAKHQRMVAKGIKKARLAALLPFVKIKEGLQRRRPRRES